MKNLITKTTVLGCAIAMLPCAWTSAIAAPPISEPVDTIVTNAVPFDSARSLTMQGIASDGQGTSNLLNINPGRLHAFNLSVAAPQGTGARCIAYLYATVTFSQQAKSIVLAHPAAVDGNAVAFAHSYSTPIEFDFDPNITDDKLTLTLETQAQGLPQGSSCYSSATFIYEEF